MLVLTSSGNDYRLRLRHSVVVAVAGGVDGSDYALHDREYSPFLPTASVEPWGRTSASSWSAVLHIRPPCFLYSFLATGGAVFCPHFSRLDKVAVVATA